MMANAFANAMGQVVQQMMQHQNQGQASGSQNSQVSWTFSPQPPLPPISQASSLGQGNGAGSPTSVSPPGQPQVRQATGAAHAQIVPAALLRPPQVDEQQRPVPDDQEVGRVHQGGGKGKGRGRGNGRGGGGGGGNPALRAGSPKFITFCKSVIEECLATLLKWAVSSSLDTSQKWRTPVEKLRGEARWRREGLMDPAKAFAVLDPSVSITADDLGRYDVVLTGVVVIQEERAHFETYTNGQNTPLNIAPKLHELNSNSELKLVWRDGHFVPCWQREQTESIKISFRCKPNAGKLEDGSLLLLVSPSERRAMCPGHIVQMLPVQFREFLRPEARKQEMLRAWWQPGLVQVRLYQHLLRQILARDDYKSILAIRSLLQKLFQSTLPHILC